LFFIISNFGHPSLSSEGITRQGCQNFRLKVRLRGDKVATFDNFRQLKGRDPGSRFSHLSLPLNRSNCKMTEHTGANNIWGRPQNWLRKCIWQPGFSRAR